MDDVKIIDRLVKDWQGQYKEVAAEVLKLILGYIRQGYGPQDAVNKAFDETDFSSRNRKVLQDKLYEAAALAYGVTPKTVNSKVVTKLMNMPWSPDNMTLSQRLHGLDTLQRKEVAYTIATNIKNGTNWVKLSRELYDGYNAGREMNTAQLPAYLNRLRYYAKQTLSMGLRPDVETMYKYNKALQRAKKLVDEMSDNGAPNQALKTAYKDLLDKAQEFSDKAIDKAARVAMEERSRYFAERIARTEIARAWTDGYLTRTYHDPDVVAYHWVISSRHPRTDICDLHRYANMYGLGPGIYPKNKLPQQPAHPHCLCMLESVYESELDDAVQQDNVDDAGQSWLKRQSAETRQDMLGKAGVEQFDDTGEWQSSCRNWLGHADPIIRLSESDFT